MTREEMRAVAEAAVADWPPLSQEDRDAIAVLLTSPVADVAA